MSALWLLYLTLALGIGTFIQILDTSIANVAIPYIAGDLAVSSSQGTWVITSFAVSNAIVLPLTGWLSKRLGAVRLFVVSTFLFSVTSLLCGLSWNIGTLIFFRILQGASAGTLIPLSQSLLLANYPEEKRGLAIGLWSMIVVVAPIVGPLLGGWITQNYGWSWIFYINVPLGLLSSFWTWSLLRKKETRKEKTPIDGIGLGLLIVSLASLQIFLDKGNELDWLNSDVIVTLIIVSIISGTFFLVWNILSPYPVVNLSFFRDRNFFIGTLLSSLSYMLFFSATVLLPLWLQTSQGYTALWAGVAAMPIGIIPVFISPFVGRYLYLFDIRIIVTISFIAFATTFFMFSNFNPLVSIWDMVIPRFYQGFAVALFFIPLLTLTLSNISKEDLPAASGLYNFLRILTGSGVGTSISVTYWERHMIRYHAEMTELVTKTKEEVIEFFQTAQMIGFSEAESTGLLNLMVTQQAASVSINNYFYLSAYLFIFSIPLVWLCKVKKQTQALTPSE